MDQHILIERRGRVEIIRLNRPEKKNAITRAMYASLAKALNESDADPDVRCRVILGQPGAFSAGNDMSDFMVVATGGEGGTEVLDFLMALAKSQKPIVSGADGIAVGIGTTIHLHCDLTFATQRTVFHTPFVDLGIVPEAGSTLSVPPIIGRQQAFALLALGEPFVAQKAMELGLIYAVVDETDLEYRVLEAAERIASKPPEGLRLTRDFLLGDRSALVRRIEEESRTFRARLKSDEARAALTAFMSRKR